MENAKWKYKIGSGKAPVFVSLAMAALFGGLSVWMHKTDNGAYFFCDILTGIMVLVLIATIYRLLFFKVLIGKDGFYYQTQIGNGLYHNYSELKDARVTSGQNLSGYETNWCHFETADGHVSRFGFYYNDKQAVQYFLRRAQSAIAKQAGEDTPRQHRIDGRSSGMVGLVGAFIAAGMLCIFDIPFLQLGGFPLLMGLIGLSFAGYIIIAVLCKYFFFQIKIEETGFYCQTNPFNGTYFYYPDIARCWKVKRVYRRRRSATRQYHFYFYFTDHHGKTRRFEYEDDIYGYEVNVLKERIEKQ